MDPAVYAAMQEQDRCHWWFVARRRILRDAIAALGLPADARILEAGCGAGGNLAMLGQFGTVSAMELDPDMRAIASERSGITVEPGRLPDKVPFEPGTFDLVAALDVVEHVDADAEAVAALGAMLRPGGTLIVTVPAYRWMWSEHDARHHHKRRYTRPEIRLLFDKAGLQANRITHFNSLLFPLAVAARMAGKLTGKNGHADDEMPPGPINAALRETFALERYLLRYTPLPAGLSILGMACKV